jgi:hypothetical protein
MQRWQVPRTGGRKLPRFSAQGIRPEPSSCSSRWTCSDHFTMRRSQKLTVRLGVQLAQWTCLSPSQVDGHSTSLCNPAYRSNRLRCVKRLRVPPLAAPGPKTLAGLAKSSPNKQLRSPIRSPFSARCTKFQNVEVIHTQHEHEPTQKRSSRRSAPNTARVEHIDFHLKVTISTPPTC